jgi:hypothetical protein
VELVRHLPVPAVAYGHVRAFNYLLFDLQGSFRLELDDSTACSLSPVRYYMYMYLLLLCMAVSSYVCKGVNAAAAVTFDTLLLIGPQTCLLWKWLRPRGCNRSINTR